MRVDGELSRCPYCNAVLRATGDDEFGDGVATMCYLSVGEDAIKELAEMFRGTFLIEDVGKVIAKAAEEIEQAQKNPAPHTVSESQVVCFVTIRADNKLDSPRTDKLIRDAMKAVGLEAVSVRVRRRGMWPWRRCIEITYQTSMRGSAWFRAAGYEIVRTDENMFGKVYACG